MYVSKSGEVAICKLLLKAGNCNAKFIRQRRKHCAAFRVATWKCGSGEGAAEFQGDQHFRQEQSREVSIGVDFLSGSSACVPMSLCFVADSLKWKLGEILKIHGVLGKGSFGTVYLVSHRSCPCRFFALKALNKSYICSHNLSKYAMIEKPHPAKFQNPPLHNPTLPKLPNAK